MEHEAVKVAHEVEKKAPLLVSAAVTYVTGNPLLGRAAGELTAHLENGEGLRKALLHTVHQEEKEVVKDAIKDVESAAVTVVAATGVSLLSQVRLDLSTTGPVVGPASAQVSGGVTTVTQAAGWIQSHAGGVDPDIVNSLTTPITVPSHTSQVAATGRQYADAGNIMSDAAVDAKPRTYNWPLPGHDRVTTGFGVKDAMHTHAHQGIDIPAPAGTPILAAHDGKVVQAGTAHGFGNWIVVQSGEQYAIYGHIDGDDLPKVGTAVKAGDRIGSIGVADPNSGEHTSGPHLHFEIRQGSLKKGHSIDPTSLLNAGG